MWRQGFTRFRSATKVSHEHSNVQVSTLILGIEAENKFKTFNFMEEKDVNDYETEI